MREAKVSVANDVGKWPGLVWPLSHSPALSHSAPRLNALPQILTRVQAKISDIG